MRKNRQRRSADLDITPLIDVMFMLIIFFVLTASFVNGRITVDLPNANAPASEETKADVTITVAKDGSVLWDGKNVTDAELAPLARGVKGRGVLIAGDKGASYGRVSQVLSILRGEGVTEAGLLMQGGK
jgi:biopolymer transport protein ExbD